MDILTIGKEYDRPDLAQLWGYSDWHGFGRGVFTPRGLNLIVLFITKEKQNMLTKYNDFFLDGLFYIEGETNHQNDKRIINSIDNGDKLYLFYREKHHKPFIYYGEVVVIKYVRNTGENPSEFILGSPQMGTVIDDILTEKTTHGIIDELFKPDSEGRKKISIHISYERSMKNRLKALEIHGTKCKICGFDFNAIYGKDLALDYIEVHHIKSISLEETIVDPVTDLIPVCSNCHSMLHRRRNGTISVEELKERITMKR